MSASSSLSPVYLRVEAMQVVAQGIPSITASVPQVHTPSAYQGREAPPPSATLSPLTPLAYPSAALLAAATETRIKELVRSAMGFMRHAQRQVLTTEDIALALRHANAQPIWGFDTASTGLTSSGLNGASASDALAFSQASEDLFLLADPLVQFDDLLAQALPPVPPDATFSVHWLAVDGIQPLIPENPGLAQPDATNATNGTGAPTTTTTLLQGQEKEVEVVTKQPIKHVLSKEQTLYYEYVTSALKGNDSTLKKAVYKSLSEDDGLYQLLPYFTQFVAEEVSRHLHNLTFLTALMRTANCLIHSKYLRIDPYLHQLMPPILTCIVGKHLCHEPFEDHWQLRDYASDMLQTVCQKFGHVYPTLQPRVSKTLVMAWMDPTRSLNTHYGCVLALRKLGVLVIKKLIVPYVQTYMGQLQPALNSTNEATKMEASFVYHALLDAVSIYVRHELDRATSPNEMAAAIRAATAANSETAAAAAARATNAATKEAAPAPSTDGSVPMEDVAVKQEPSDSSTKKRRRGDPAAAAGASASSASAAGVASAASLPASSSSSSSPSSLTALLPDLAALSGIEMLLDLFGEALQTQVDAALRALQERDERFQEAQRIKQEAERSRMEEPQAPAVRNREGKMVLSRNTLTAANAFL